MSQPESSLDSLKAKCFSKKSAKLHFWCAHSTSLPMLAKMSSSVFRKAPCVQRAYKNTEKKTLFWFTETEMFSLSHALLERFLGFSPFAFRSFRCLTARLDISVSSSFYVVFGNFASNAFPGFCAGCTGWLLKWPGLAQMSKTHVFMGSELKNENT